MAGRPTEAVADMSCLLGGPHDLANERVRLAPSDASIANAAEPDAEVIVTRVQGCSPLRRLGDGAERVEMVGAPNGNAGRGVQRDGKIALSNQPLAPSRTAALLSCHPSVGRPPPHASMPNARHHAKSCEPRSNRSLRPPVRHSAYEQTMVMGRRRHRTCAHRAGILQPICIGTA